MNVPNATPNDGVSLFSTTVCLINGTNKLQGDFN